MKHTIIIKMVNGKIDHIQTSGDTDIILIEETPNMKSISELEPDHIFEIGKGHEAYMGDTRQFLKNKGI